MRRLALLAALVVAVGASPSPAPARGPAPVARAAAPAAEPAWRTEVRALLERRAAAVRDGDERVFAATMAAAPADWRRARLASFRRLQALPLASYALELEDHGYADLSAALPRRPRGDEVRVVHAVERLALRGYDVRPSADDLFLTVVRRNGAWSVTGDEDVEDLGLLSARSLWDAGDIEVLERDDVLVLTRGTRESAERILAETIDARERVRRRWPGRWRRAVVVVIPRSARELARMLRVAFDVSPFVAFTGSSVDRTDADWRLTAHRVYVQPDAFFATSRAFQQDTLSHELLHLATRAHASPFTPAWLDEGVAQVYGERPGAGTVLLSAAIRRGTFGRRLPQDAHFLVGNDIKLAYEASASFVRHLDRRHGEDAGARLYRAVGAQPRVGPGTWRYHLDRAARAALGTPLRKLERAWIRTIEEGFG